MDEDLQNDILASLKCEVCKNYMGPPIYTCLSGHGVCEDCKESGLVCSCKLKVSDSRNFAVEAFAVKVKYPCKNNNGGCTVRLAHDERKEHHSKCSAISVYTCHFGNCAWTGRYDCISRHWSVKRAVRPYVQYNACHWRVKSSKYFVNMVKAYDELFWYLFESYNDRLYWCVQYIGPKNKARNYYYEIVFTQRRQPLKRLVFTNYCQLVTNRKLERNVYGVAVPMDMISQYISRDNTLYFTFNVYKVGDNEKCLESLGACSLPVQPQGPESILVDLSDNQDDDDNAPSTNTEYPVVRRDANENPILGFEGLDPTRTADNVPFSPYNNAVEQDAKKTDSYVEYIIPKPDASSPSTSSSTGAYKKEPKEKQSKPKAAINRTSPSTWDHSFSNDDLKSKPGYDDDDDDDDDLKKPKNDNDVSSTRHTSPRTTVSWGDPSGASGPYQTFGRMSEEERAAQRRNRNKDSKKKSDDDCLIL